MSPSTKLTISLAIWRFCRRRHHNHSPAEKTHKMPRAAAMAMPTLAAEVIPASGCGWLRSLGAMLGGVDAAAGV